MARPKYINLYIDYLDAIKPLSDAERGRLFTALLEYGETGTVPELSGNERFIFPMMRAQTDRDFTAYEDKCRKNSNNRKQSTTNDNDRQQPSTDETKEKEKKKEKEKENNNPLYPPSGDGENKKSSELTQAEQTKAELKAIRNSFAFGAELDKAVNDWLKYKHERRDNYKPMGLKSLLTEIKNNAVRFSDSEVIRVINESMASNYDGIIWNKLKEANPTPKKNRACNFEGRKIDYSEIERQEQEYINTLIAGKA